jgi:hypothetical protein
LGVTAPLLLLLVQQRLALLLLAPLASGLLLALLVLLLLLLLPMPELLQLLLEPLTQGHCCSLVHQQPQ